MDIDEELIDIGEEEEEKQQETIQLKQSPPITEEEWNDNEIISQVQDSDMDDESRKLIEQMLAEEEYYYGKDSLSKSTSHTTSTKKKRKGVVKEDSDYQFDLDRASPSLSSIKKSKKEGAISSASLPSHKTRWNIEEDDLLREALVKFGYGNWKPISEYVKTRNPLQCKNHARHLAQTDKVDINSLSPSKSVKKEQESPKKEIVAIEEKEEMDTPMEEDEDVVSIDGSDNIKSIRSSTSPQSMPSSVLTPKTPPPPPVQAPVSPAKPIIEQQEQEQEQEQEQAKVRKDIPVVTNNNKIPEFPQSDQQPCQDHTTTFDRFQVSDQEILQNPEWFKQKYSKTPDRYIKIRNHMLDCWQACKPKYLTKTSARKGLKDCGDVNAIGRVHEYLESIGAINVDCTTHAPRPPKRVPREVYEEEEEEGEFLDALDLVLGYDGPRKRKVRNEKGEWVDPKELEGRVIEHGQVVVQLDTKPKRVTKRSHHYYERDEFKRGYDPFRLVPTSHYHEELPAPFEVEIISDALLVMDFHSHLAHTEIIGLLGGNFITRDDNTQKVLQVKSVFPCQSTSTGIQCEMDPASEMKAREVFAEKGFDVVGWYHSHPTFEPHPSIRDIENQTSYQTLFRKEDTGDEPFIGVIVTPYDPEMLSDHSQIQYLHISKEWNDSNSYRAPYACRRTVIQSEQVSSEIFNQLVALIGEYKDYEHKVNMLKPFGEQTRMEKLLDSLRAHLFVSQEDEELFINAVKEIVMKDFVDAVEKDQSGSATSHKVEQEKEGGSVSTTSNTTSENVEKESGTTTMEKMDVDSSIV